MKIGFVTDSTCDIPADLAQKHGIEIMQNMLMMDGKQYTDTIDISRSEFYARLPQLSEPVTTGTAASGKYVDLYERMLKAGCDAIISIHPSALLSGILNAASAAAQDFGGRVRTFDSQQISMGLGFQVLAAVEAARQGASLEKLIEYLSQIRQRVRVIAMLDTLEFAFKSGRVSWAKAMLGGMLSIKPFIEIAQGKVMSIGQVRTRAKGLLHLLKLKHDLGVFERLAILHGNTEDEARKFLQLLAPADVPDPLLINITPVIGAHAGPNALGFAGILRG